VKPLTLTIEGLTSFKTPQTIELSDFDLFVITGPTGAGKSSVLDAITFALYGSVCRVGKHELRDLISHGSSYMRVCLDFQVGGQRYRVARRMGRNSHTATLERIDGESSVTEIERGGIRAVDGRLEEIVGLDFKAFTKAVLLPQGDFDEFLKGEPGERRRILIRLLDLGRYEQAGQIARREATRLDAIIGDRKLQIETTYADANKERLQELKRAAKTAADEQKRIDGLKKTARAVAARAAETETTRSSLLGASDEVQGVLNELTRLEVSWPPLKSREETVQEELDLATKAMKQAQDSFKQAGTVREATIRRTGDAALIAKLEAAATAYADERAELERLDRDLAEVAALIKQLEEKREGLEARGVSTASGLETASASRTKAEANRNDAEAVLGCARASAVLEELAGQVASATRDASAASKAAEEARLHLRHLETEHAAVALRVGLGPGDPCPVCHAQIEVLPKGDRGLAGLLERARKATDTTRTREQSTGDALVAVNTQHAAAEQQLTTALKQLAKGTVVPDVASARQFVERAISELAVAEKAEREARIAADASIKDIGEVKSDLEVVGTRLSGTAKNREGADARFQTALATLSGTFKKLPRDLQVEVARRRQELDGAEKAYEQAVSALERARLDHDETKQRRDDSAQLVAAFDNELASVGATGRMACESVARLIGGDALAELAGPEGDRTDLLLFWSERSQRSAEAARKAIAAAGEEFDAAMQELAGLATEAGLVIKAKDATVIAATLDDAATDAHGAVVAAKKDVEAHQGRIRDRQHLEAQIAEDRQLCALYQALATELRSDHFVAFVLEESMIQLAAQASDELLRISDERYSLIADEGNFAVIDHHNADERRSVATLSGGESFLASLSLALALSAGLRELSGIAAGRLEAIFIDEGFGALDPETLEVVVDALERLREGDRMVGVITHVPTLADRIPAGLVIEKSGNSSQILTR
jgi:DNA repair protein SbcC/Rad50